MRCHLKLVRMAIIKTIHKQQMLENVLKDGNTPSLCWNVNWYNHCGEQYEGSLKN